MKPFLKMQQALLILVENLPELLGIYVEVKRTTVDLIQIIIDLNELKSLTVGRN